MIKGNHQLEYKALHVALCAVVIAAFAMGALAQTPPPVSVSVVVTGDPVPGSTVTAKATVTINNGSTLQGIVWTQTGGVEATLANTTTDTVSVTLPGRLVFKEELIELLEEPPSLTGPLPGDAPVPDPFEGGLQDRFGVVGIAPLTLEEAGAINLRVAVTTSSGTYNTTTAVHAHLPWTTATGIRNVPILVPVLLHGVTQATYDWELTRPAGSLAVLTDATAQSPDFTPDVVGSYTLTVTNLETGQPVSIDIIAGTWRGVIIGQDDDGRPVVDTACTLCHTWGTIYNQPVPWKASGHSEILTQNVNNPAGHYSTNCISCHTVGYNTEADNGGVDESPDFEALLASGRLTHGAADNWTEILAQFPASAQLMNIQCENCHGPQEGEGHRSGTGARTSLSSDVCGSCHGEPPRHGRFQQWQVSKHANYELAREEGTNASCAKCHSAQGFVQWAKNDFSAANITVDWTVDEVHPITCATCHEPHGVGTVSGSDPVSTVRLMGDTPLLMSGYIAKDMGSAATCMTCHNGRRGLRNDGNFSLGDAARAPHLGPQSDIVMGQNLYFTEVGTPGFHSMIEDSCVTCHMESTDPPADLSYALGGTNHVFFASKDICSDCHAEITAESIQEPVHAKLEELKHEIEMALMASMQEQIRAGNMIDIGGTAVADADDILGVELVESHGRQAVTVELTGAVVVHDIGLNAVKVVRPTGTSVELYAVSDPAIPKAAWNYFSIEADGSMGVHNTSFVNSALDVSLFATKAVNAAMTDPSIGGGPGNNAGAVSCTTPYVYWAEIAGHMPGENSQWRTDLVARNLSSYDASLEFFLHETAGGLEGNGTVSGGAQLVFEDIVATMGGTNNIGSLEICSDRPLLVMARIFNQDAAGTYGQGFDGHVASQGYGSGQTVNLIGMRQTTEGYRTNLSVTNGGTTEAEVSVTLYNASGTALHTFKLTVPAGKMVQDLSPFANRANAPDVGWGFATVTVLKGTNIQASASMVDRETNDPTTIPAKQ